MMGKTQLVMLAHCIIQMKGGRFKSNSKIQLRRLGLDTAPCPKSSGKVIFQTCFYLWRKHDVFLCFKVDHQRVIWPIRKPDLDKGGKSVFRFLAYLSPGRVKNMGSN